MRSALVAGALLAFALSFDEVIVTTFTAGGQQTLPLWILTNLSRPNQLPIVNVVGVAVIVLSAVPVYLAHRLTRDEAVVRRGRPPPGHRWSTGASSRVWCFLVALAGGLVGLVLGNLRLPATVFVSTSAAAGGGANLAISAIAALTGGVVHIRAGRINWRLVALDGAAVDRRRGGRRLPGGHDPGHAAARSSSPRVLLQAGRSILLRRPTQAEARARARATATALDVRAAALTRLGDRRPRRRSSA